MNELPDGWSLRRLEELTPGDRPICYGILMPKAHIADGVPYVKVKDFSRGPLDVSQLRRTSPEIAAKYARSALRSGDVLISIRGTYGRVTITPAELAGGNITQDTARVTPSDEILGRFLALYFQSPDAQDYFKRVARGVAVKGVNIRDLRQLPVPVPSRAEQRRVVDVLEEHLSRCQAATRLLERVRSQLDVLRRAATDHAFAGLGECPIASGGEVFEYITSGSRGWAKYYAPSGDFFIRVGNVPRGSIKLDLTDVQFVDPPDGVEGRRTQVAPGDVLITITADVGRVAVAPPDLQQAYINQHVALARPRAGISPAYLAWFIRSRSGQAQLRGLQRGATKAGLGLDDIRALQIPVPPFEVQQSVCSRLTSLAEELDSRELQLAAGGRRAEALQRAILSAAFAGRLVPQDLDEEAATSALDRIRAERPAATSISRHRKVTTS